MGIGNQTTALTHGAPESHQVNGAWHPLEGPFLYTKYLVKSEKGFWTSLIKSCILWYVSIVFHPGTYNLISLYKVVVSN